MTKGNKIRLIFWGFIWLLVLATMIVGIYEYYNGNGVLGKIRKELYPIVEKYNKLNELNIYKNAGINIKAKYIKNAIKVNYKTNSSNLAYIFEYKEINDTKVLYMKYNETNHNITQIIVKQMLDAVSINNNHNEGEIFNIINYDDLYQLSLDKGISLKYNDSVIELYIDINKSVADYISGKERINITENELENMNKELNDNKQFTYTKKDITIYVESKDDKYIIYAQNTNYDDDLYKSIVNVINSLDLKQITKTDFELNYPSISISKEFNNYNIIINDDAKDIDVFKTKTNIIKIEIKKDIN